jgi:hypothetical protein
MLDGYIGVVIVIVFLVITVLATLVLLYAYRSMMKKKGEISHPIYFVIMLFSLMAIFAPVLFFYSKFSYLEVATLYATAIIVYGGAFLMYMRINGNE